MQTAEVSIFVFNLTMLGGDRTSFIERQRRQVLFDLVVSQRLLHTLQGFLDHF